MFATGINDQRVIHISLMVLVFLPVFVAYTLERNYQYGDSYWSTYTAMSIIREGNTDLDEYSDAVHGKDNYGVLTLNNHIYSGFPIGASIIALPPLFLANALDNDYHTYFTDNFSVVVATEEAIAAFIVAMTAVVIFLIGELFLKKRYALVLVFIFSFCTSAWSTASRSLWQHGPSMLCLAIALYLLLLARNKPKLVQFAALPLAFSYVVRPTNSISILFLALYVLIEYRKYFLRFVFWSLPVAVPFIIFNYSLYGAPLSSYYSISRLFTNPNFFEALAGNLVSPARGILFFSPVLLFSIAGLVIKAGAKRLTHLDIYLLGN